MTKYIIKMILVTKDLINRFRSSIFLKLLIEVYIKIRLNKVEINLF